MQKRICIWGDSVTWGAGLPLRVAWANLLRNYLEKDFQKDSILELYDLGIDGNTSEDVLYRFEKEAQARNPNIIIFAFGVNDSAYRKEKNNVVVSLEQFIKNTNELYTKALAFTETVIFVGLAKGSDAHTKPLPRSTTGKCYDKESVRRYNGALKHFCSEKGCIFIDVLDVLHDEDFNDGLHPNISGHIKIFEQVRKTLHNEDII